MRGAAEILRTAMGNPMSFPTSDGTTEEGEIVDQHASATAADVTFGTLALPVYKYSSKVVTVPVDLLMASSIYVESFVPARLVPRMGRITYNHITTRPRRTPPHEKGEPSQR